MQLPCQPLDGSVEGRMEAAGHVLGNPLVQPSQVRRMKVTAFVCTDLPQHVKT